MCCVQPRNKALTAVQEYEVRLSAVSRPLVPVALSCSTRIQIIPSCPAQPFLPTLCAPNLSLTQSTHTHTSDSHTARLFSSPSSASSERSVGSRQRVQPSTQLRREGRNIEGRNREGRSGSQRSRPTRSALGRALWSWAHLLSGSRSRR